MLALLFSYELSVESRVRRPTLSTLAQSPGNQLTTVFGFRCSIRLSYMAFGHGGI